MAQDPVLRSKKESDQKQTEIKNKPAKSMIQMMHTHNKKTGDRQQQQPERAEELGADVERDGLAQGFAI